MKRILVTGGAGFIGSHLCEALLAEGHEVYCLDNLYTGSEENISHLKKNSRFHFISADIITYKESNIRFDQVYNLACPASPPHYQKDPVFTWKTSVLGVLNMLEIAKQHHAVFLQTSTSEVYGDPLVHPQKESYWGNVNPVGLRSCYDEGKRAAETIIMDWHRKHGTDIKIVRIFNTYGPRMDPNDGRVVSNFIVQALQNKDITMYGDGKQTRSFCYVSDMVKGLMKMMNSDNFLGPVNLGNPGEFTMLELAQKVIAMTSSKSKMTHKALPPDDPAKRKPDIAVAKMKLNWEPSIKLDDGLKETIAYFRNKLSKDL